MGTYSGPGAGLGSAGQYLDGQFLIAMPSMSDDRFARSVIYVCAHSSDGAMGIVLNQAAPNVDFADLLIQLEIIPAYERGRLVGRAGDMTVRYGGPVETSRGFVLHTSDYALEHATLPIDETLSLTTTLEVLRAIAGGRGPAKAILALGYAGWGPGQLESEIQANGWLHCPADMATIFGCELDDMYDHVLRKLGVDLANLSTSAGHA